MTRVKICGLTTLEDAQQATELGAWALGMIFWAGSPRACTVEQAEAIGAQLQPLAVLTGVYLNAPLYEVAATEDVCRFSLLQLHVLPGGGPPHRLPDHQGGARARWGAGGRAARLSHRPPSPGRALAEGAWGNG